MHRLYANAVSFYNKGLEHPWMLVCVGVLEPIPLGPLGMTALFEGEVNLRSGNLNFLLGRQSGTFDLGVKISSY